MHLKGPLRVLALLYTLLFLLPLAVLLMALFLPRAEGGVFFIFPFVIFSSEGGGSAWILFPLLFILLLIITTLYAIHILFSFTEERFPEPRGMMSERGVSRDDRHRGLTEGEQEVGASGIILLGPIPIVFSTSRGGSALFLLLPLVFLLLFLAFIGILLLST